MERDFGRRGGEHVLCTEESVKAASAPCNCIQRLTIIWIISGGRSRSFTAAMASSNLAGCLEKEKSHASSRPIEFIAVGMTLIVYHHARLTNPRKRQGSVDELLWRGIDCARGIIGSWLACNLAIRAGIMILCRMCRYLASMLRAQSQ